MAEFLDKRPRPRVVDVPGTDGFDAMGKPVPLFRRTNALAHCKQMGLNSNSAWEVVGAVTEQLERDQPYEAMQAGMIHLDLTGTYRLMAVLLTGEEKKETA